MPIGGKDQKNMPERDFDSIYQAYSRLVYWAAYRVLNDHEMTEDAVQDVFITVLKSMDKISALPDAQLKAWLYRVAVNLAVDMKRHSSKELLSDEPVGAEVADDGETPEDETIGADTKKAVREALGRVPEVYREMLVMLYYSEMSVKDIAEALNISEGTVKSRLARGRKILEKELRAKGIDYV